MSTIIVYYLIIGMTQFGPFGTLADCEKVKREGSRSISYVSQCWSAPMVVLDGGKKHGMGR